MSKYAENLSWLFVFIHCADGYRCKLNEAISILKNDITSLLLSTIGIITLLSEQGEVSNFLKA